MYYRIEKVNSSCKNDSILNAKEFSFFIRHTYLINKQKLILVCERLVYLGGVFLVHN